MTRQIPKDEATIWNGRIADASLLKGVFGNTIVALIAQSVIAETASSLETVLIIRENTGRAHRFQLLCPSVKNLGQYLTDIFA